jgi:hypothetical protein
MRPSRSTARAKANTKIATFRNRAESARFRKSLVPFRSVLLIKLVPRSEHVSNRLAFRHPIFEQAFFEKKAVEHPV